MNPIRGAVLQFSRRARERRASIFRDAFSMGPTTRLLDLGSQNGSHFHSVLGDTDYKPENVWIADISEDLVKEGERRFGFRAVLLDESGRLPFEDGFFDIVHCSSVIEHVSVPKEEMWTLWSGRRFHDVASRRQAAFAQELRRVARGYYVQTPYRHFPVESHTWLPGVAWLPRPALLLTLRGTNRVWVKKTQPDWNLLDHETFGALFPDAEIREEKVMGLTKSLIAIRRP